MRMRSRGRSPVPQISSITTTPETNIVGCLGNGSTSKPDLPALAAVYGHGIAKNHPFSDGKTRTAFVCAAVFLGLNGVKLTLSEPRAIEMMLALAAGKMSQEDVANLIRENSGTIRKGKDKAQ